MSRYDHEADYVVVGAGSSGCVVVHRLSADPSLRIALIEAGPPADADPAVSIPGRWVSLIGSSYDWGDSTEPEPALADRRIAFPRGRAHGGSSAINAMAHIRGHRGCFDTWRAAGNPGWGFDDLLPVFMRSESSDAGAPGWRGTDGPLAVRRCLDAHEGHHAFLAAAAREGFRADPAHDFNMPEPGGVAGFYQKNILNGRRHSASAAFLVPALARLNVHCISPAHATRVIVDRGRAEGVEYVRAGRPHRVRAIREVVLCAGAVRSPQLLMLSGIGPADHLRAHGVEVVADRHGVGRHLQDHLKVSIRWRGTGTLPGSTVTAGLFTSSVPSPAASPIQDLQLFTGRGTEQPDELVTITVSCVRPASRGAVTLRSADPFAAPVIRACYLEAAADLEALREGVRLARLLGSSRAYDRLRAEEIEPGSHVRSAADLDRFIRQKADTFYHAAGTCRMGPASDAGAVVDASLCVHGIERLRVADASIMPVVVNAPTHAACVAIGEKCAALILGGGGRAG